MRFMMIIKSNATTEAGGLPSEEAMAEMGKYNAELVKAGVLVDGAGLRESRLGARVNFKDGKPSVVDGPFAEAKELVAGFWIIDVKSKAEAVEWARRVPFNPKLPHGGEGQIEVRQVFSAEDLPADSVAVAEEKKLRAAVNAKYER